MFKKKLLTLACAVFCAAIVTAQTPKSEVSEATYGLVEDGAIDSLAFGNEDGNGIVFGKYDNNNGKVELGWGNALSDTLWLSFYDGFTIYGNTRESESVTKVYGVNDGVNVDYVDERPRVHKADNSAGVGNSMWFNNVFAAGVAINNTFGVQAVWDANWSNWNKAATITAGNSIMSAGDNGTDTLSSEEKFSATGKKVSKSYDNVENFSRANKITFNFKGAGIEDLGDIAFYAKLNKVYTDLNFNKRANDYSEKTSVFGTTTEKITANGLFSATTIRPGIEIETGFNLPEWGVVKPSIAFVEDFNIGFDVIESNTSYTNVKEDNTEKNTKKTDFEYTPGKTVDWKNTFTPKFKFDFDVLEQLTLKAEVSAAVAVAQNNKEAGTWKTTETSTTYYKTYGETSKTVKTTEGGDRQNVNEFKTTVTPKIDLGLVYQLIPGKTNLNFGIEVAPGSYSWTTTETTNSNINTITTTKTTDEYGVTGTSKNVQIANNGTETKETTFVNYGTAANFRLGATWFFTENVKLDVTYGSSFGDVFGTSKFGADICVLF